MRTRKNPLIRLLGMIHKLHAPTGDLLNEIRFFFERGIYGWSSQDSWDITSCLDRIIPEMVRYLKEKKQGVPSILLSSWNPTDEELEEAGKRYDAILDDIAEGFETHRANQDIGVLPQEEKYSEIREKIKKGMTLFVEYYDTLWW